MCYILSSGSTGEEKGNLCINPDFNFETATKICKEMSRSIYRMTFWKRNNLIKRKFRGSRAGKKPRHLLWNVFIVLLQYIWKFFVIIGHLDPSRQQCTHQHPPSLLKKRLWHRCFPVNFAKFLRTPFSQNTSGQLFLYYKS